MDGTMMCGRMMLGEVVGLVEMAWFPVDKELALADAVAELVELHVNGFGSFLFDGVINDAGGGVVVGLERGRRLGVAQFFQSDTDGTGVFGVVK